MPEFKFTVSGYRAKWGEGLTTDVAKTFASAFFNFTKEDSEKDNPKILIARDGRESGLQISEAIIPLLENFGAEVVNGDILPTPTILFACKAHKFDGAIIITASHNPIEYNGLKFVTKDARITNEMDVEAMKKFLYA